MRGAEIGLAIFAKAPVPGRVKTRLAPALGEEGAARLYAAFLEDLVARLGALPGVATALWAAAPSDREALARFGLPVRVQPPGDLGARMRAALDATLENHGKALLVGSDAPTLPASRLADAARALDDADVAIGPAIDGGYYLVGVRGRGLDFGASVRWSTRHALADTLARARADGRRVARIRPFYDVDEPDDLRLLRLATRVRPDLAPATAAVLAHFDRASPA